MLGEPSIANPSSTNRSPATIEELFDLFFRLRNDECFEDWLQLGIPTTIDTEPDTVQSEFPLWSQSKLNTASSSSRELVTSHFHVGGGTSSSIEVEDGSLPPNQSPHRGRRSLVKGSSRDDSTQRVLVKKVLELSEETLPLEPAGESEYSRRLQEWIRRVRTSLHDGYVGDAADVPEETSESRRRNFVDHKARKLPAIPGFNFQHFEQLARGKISELTTLLDEKCRPVTEGFVDFVERSAEALRRIVQGECSETFLAHVKSLLATGPELSQLAFQCSVFLTRLEDLLLAQVAKNSDDFFSREEILAQAAALLIRCDQFQGDMLALAARLKDVEDFQETASYFDQRIRSLVDPLISELSRLFESVPFPNRRACVMSPKNRSQIEAAINEILQLLEELGGHPPFPIEPHQEWRQRTLDLGFDKLQSIASLFDSLALGYVDPAVEFGTALRQEAADGLVKTTSVSMAKHIRHLRVVEQTPFDRIADIVKETNEANQIIGLQLCMSARYLLHEEDEGFDPGWGFSM